MSVSTLTEPNSSAAATTDTSNSGTLRLVSLCTCTYSIVCTYVYTMCATIDCIYIHVMDWQCRVHCIRDVIGLPPYGHGEREIGGSHE